MNSPLPQKMNDLRAQADHVFSQASQHSANVKHHLAQGKYTLANAIHAHPYRWAIAATGGFFAVKWLAKPIIHTLPHLAAITRFALGVITGQKLMPTDPPQKPPQ